MNVRKTERLCYNISTTFTKFRVKSEVLHLEKMYICIFVDDFVEKLVEICRQSQPAS
jgi:hypothetical protein